MRIKISLYLSFDGEFELRQQPANRLEANCSSSTFHSIYSQYLTKEQTGRSNHKTGHPGNTKITNKIHKARHLGVDRSIWEPFHGRR